MQSFPMFIKMADRRVVIVGGDEQAAQKSRLMLKTDAAITIAAPELDDELQALVDKGRADHHTGPITADLFRDVAMVLIGTGCPAVDASIHAIAKSVNALVNVVDQPALCDATTPSIVDRDPVVIAIGTEGNAPVMGRSIKTQIEKMLDPRLGNYVALAGRLRDSVAQKVARENRREFWRWAFNDAPWQAFKRGAEREAAELLKTAIETGAKQTEGQISLVGAGPGARDLLTLRAVERLQEADVIFYDRLVDPDVLELARRDAERVYVGKVVGAHAIPQSNINQLIVNEARKGRRVVRLKSGDPSIFGRATEELESARELGIPTEIIPGVTAASAAAAAMGRSLTERGEIDSVVFTTGHSRQGADAPLWHHHVHPGTRMIYYMAVSQAAALRDKLLESGLPADATGHICANVTHKSEHIFDVALGTLVEDLKSHDVGGCAIIMFTWRKGEFSADQAKKA
ncbi:siroheme synthase CysG [Marivivens niveibacter]|nr:siroheme synthase CysG [Marivivens niveibacter]